MKEELITTYKEYEQVVENGENKKVKGLGRLMAYQGLDYLKEQINQCKLIGNDEDYIKLDVYNEILSKIEKSDK